MKMIEKELKDKKGQEQKPKVFVSMPKKAQEEIVGFAIIVIIVSIIVVFFLVFSLSNRESQIESYEATSFLQSTLQYTSSCESRSQLLSVQELVVACYDEQTCGEEREDACDVLTQTLEDIAEESWQIGADFPVKGYKIEVFSGEASIISISEGNMTSSYKGSQQPIPESGIPLNIAFTAYY